MQHAGSTDQGRKLTDALFALTPVYIRESKADQGVLIASREPLHELLIELLAALPEKEVSRRH